jgi:hypothetical protein
MTGKQLASKSDDQARACVGATIVCPIQDEARSKGPIIDRCHGESRHSVYQFSHASIHSPPHPDLHLCACLAACPLPTPRTPPLQLIPIITLLVSTNRGEGRKRRCIGIMTCTKWLMPQRQVRCGCSDSSTARPF